MSIKFDITNRFNLSVIFTAEIEADESALRSIKLGLAVQVALKAKADLRYADLSYADLSYADLRYADLRYADLRYADLSYADLSYADPSYADLRYADLSYADLSYIAGSSAFLRAVWTGVYPVTYTDTIMQIGCQRHLIADWFGFDDRRIAEMDGKNALTFWRAWKPILQMMIEASPAEPTGFVETPTETAAAAA